MSLQACHVLSHRQLDQEFCVIASAGKIQGEFFNTIGQNQTFASTSRMLDALVSPWSCLGAAVGLALAVVVHWAAPIDVDTVQAGAWLVGIGWVAGLAWDLISRESAK